MKIAVEERGHNLLDMLAWLKQTDLQIGEDYAWYREMRSPANPMLRFTFENGKEDTAMMFALRWV
jgi:hypothetical protein